MNFSFILLLSLVCLLDAFNSKRRCILYNKQCVPHCPHNMHPYHTRCDGQTISQHTCKDPSIYVIGYTCGWSRCDCNGDLLLDEDTGHCVEATDCPDPTIRRRTSAKKPKKPFRMPKTFHARDYADPLEGYMRETGP